MNDSKSARRSRLWIEARAIERKIAQGRKTDHEADVILRHAQQLDASKRLREKHEMDEGQN